MTLTATEEAHAASITDASPTLEDLPQYKVPRILIGAVFRKPPQVIEAFLQQVGSQILQHPADLSFCFLLESDDRWNEDIKKLLKDFKKTHATITHTLTDAPAYENHQWSAELFDRVADAKNRLLTKAAVGHYDYLWLLDADVLVDRHTLQSLLDNRVPIVSAVYWTRWQLQHPPLPQVWLRHPYVLSGNYGFGGDPAEFLRALSRRKRVRVGGLGACTLLATDAIRKGVSFKRIPEGLPQGPMSDGEDRHFCERARRLHIQLHADAWPDIYHAYHEADYPNIPAWLAELNSPHKERPELGDLVSAMIEPIEPVQTARGMEIVNAQFLRGRLGALAALPEIERTIASLAVGERSIVPVMFPSTFEYPPLRGQRRLLAITLQDCKAFREPPLYA